jgi:hypothetical protein
MSVLADRRNQGQNRLTFVIDVSRSKSRGGRALDHIIEISTISFIRDRLQHSPWRQHGDIHPVFPPVSSRLSPEKSRSAIKYSSLHTLSYEMSIAPSRISQMD